MKSHRDLPLLLIYPALAALFMLAPAIHATMIDEDHIAQSFFYSAIAVGFVTGLIIIATAHLHVESPLHSQLRAFVLSYLLLPLIFAIPFWQALPDTSFTNAWWEMVSSFTTTGATLYTPTRLADPLHLWRGLVGWLGGLNVLIATASILASLNLGGFELLATRAYVGLHNPRSARHYDANQRLWDHARTLLPVYLGLTLALWALLHTLGEKELTALMHAMAALSTSGISPVGGIHGGQSGIAGEIALAAVLCFALSRRLMRGAAWIEADYPLWRDPELRVAAIVIGGVSVMLFARHWISGTTSTPQTVTEALRALWGALFTVISFLTTTGFESTAWGDTIGWTGLRAPWVLLTGLAIIGGGVATTSGGVKLLRVYALAVLCKREMDRLSEPSSVAGGGRSARQLRGDGALYAFVFFLLFALTLGAVNLALAALQLPFETALILSVSALTTTGPMPALSRIAELDWAGLGGHAKFVLAVSMVLGRLETLAVIAFLLPSAWRR